MDKKSSRIRRAAKTRAKIRSLETHRLCVHRTPRHIYAQIISTDGTTVVTSASTVQADVKSQVGKYSNIDAATVVGRAIGEKAVELGVTKVALDRSGFKYHGRIKALADAAREAGLKF